MKRVIMSLFSIPLVAGCLSSAPKAPTHWMIDYDGAVTKTTGGLVTSEGLRISNVHVSAPFDGKRMTVLRKDGSVAFDAFNSFAADPTVLLREATMDAVRCSGRFGNVINGSSFERSGYVLEVYVRTLTLDCRAEGRRDALVELYVTVLKDRDFVTAAAGVGRVPVTDNFSGAFSAAFSEAMRAALSSTRAVGAK